MRSVIAALPALLLACSPAGDDPSDALAIDLDMGTGDMRPAVEWDTGDGKRNMNMRDGGEDPDASVTACLAQGGTLAPTYEGEPIEGLEGVRADLDPDGDGQPDLLLTTRRPDGLVLEMADGRSLDRLANLVLPGAVSFELMVGLTPRLDLLTPIEVAGESVYYGVERRADTSVNLLVLKSADLSVERSIPIEGGLRGVRVMGNATRWFALVDTEAGDCAIYPLEHSLPLEQSGRCHVAPGWDANGDGQVDVVRSGVGGTAILDGNLLEPIATDATPSVALGFAPAWRDPDNPTGGPVDLRGMGPEVVAASFENNQLVFRYLDPVDLDQQGDPQSLNGTFSRVEFRMTPDGLRALAEEERGLKYLRVLVPGPGLTVPRRGEFGGFRHLVWGEGVDIDEDGAPELVIYGGAREDFANTDVLFASVADAEPVWTLRRDGPARLEGAWVRRDGVQVPSDVDGCEGSERVFLRVGAAANDGSRPTRVLAFDTDGDEVFRSEGYSARVHRLALADLDGDGVTEILEVRSEGAEAARLRVYARPGE